jgi:integrase
VFRLAIKDRVIQHNPAEFVDIPKNAEKSERVPLTNEQIRWILDTPHRAQTAAMLMTFSGLRRGEASALLWTDIDFEKSTLTVSKSLDMKTHPPTVKKPKTRSGQRTVNIPYILCDYLRALLQSSPHVITSASQSVMTATAWQKLWISYMNALENKYGQLKMKREKGEYNW